MAAENIIEIKDLMKAYDDRVIIRDVNFSIKPGEIICIAGGSGCGKSTLLRQIIGLERPTEGSVWVDGENFSDAEQKDRKRIQHKFGVLFQASGLFASMTIAENIKLVLETYTELSLERIHEIIHIKLNAVGLLGYENFIPSEISGGMKKRAALARAMALDPAILFFDEPSSGLDPVTAADLDRLILEINRSMKTSMVIVSHDLASIKTIAHRVVLLDKSQKGVIAIGSPEELENQNENKRVYNFFNRIPEM